MSIADTIREKVKKQQALLRQNIQDGIARAKMPKRKPLKIETESVDDPLAAANFTGDPVHDLNEVIAATGRAIDAEKAKRAPHAKLKSNASSEKRSYDADFYCVLIFDTHEQNEAFVNAIKAKAHYEAGNLFLDGRKVADGLGIVLPEPEYKLKDTARIGVKNASTKKAKARAPD